MMKVQKQTRNENVFFIIIPVFILVLAVVFDFVMIRVQNARVVRATEYIVENVLTTNVTDLHERVEGLFEDRSIDTEQLEVHLRGDAVYIFNVHLYPPFFGRLLFIPSYRTEVSIRGTYRDGTVTLQQMDPEDIFAIRHQQ